MIKLQAGKTITSQLRNMQIGDEMKIKFSEKLPHILKTLSSKLHREEGIAHEFTITDNYTIVKRIL